MAFNRLQQYGTFVSTPPVPGILLHYVYDAKLKNELPYWDRFPLCLPTDLYEDGWLGLNLHYVPQKTRQTILNELYKYADYNPRARVEASYKLLKGASIFDDVKPCIKRYLTTHVKSRLLEINPVHWDKIIKLPTAQWQNSTPYKGAK